MSVKIDHIVYTVWQARRMRMPMHFEVTPDDAAAIVAGLAEAGLVDSPWMDELWARVELIEQRRAELRGVVDAAVEASRDPHDKHHPNPED